jgi:sugar diacid utilization regulator
MSSTLHALTIFGGRPRIGQSDTPLEFFFDGLRRIVFIEERSDLNHIEPGDLAVALGGAAGRTIGSLKRSAAKLQRLGAVALMAHERVLDAAPTSRSFLPDGPFPLILISREVEWPSVLQPLMHIDTQLKDKSGNPELRRAELMREIVENEGRVQVDAGAALAVGLDLNLPVRAIYVASSGQLLPETRGRLEEAIAFELLTHDPNGTVVATIDSVAAFETIGPGLANNTLPESLRRRAASVPNLPELAIGVGSPRRGTEGIYQSLREAKWAAKVGYRLEGPNIVMEFEDTGAYSWLEPIAFERSGRACEAIETIIERDGRQGTRLLETLEVYLETRRLKEASDKLFVHRNTLRYRLDAIKKITGYDVQDPEGRLILELQLRLAKVNGVLPRHDDTLVVGAAPESIVLDDILGSEPDELAAEDFTRS